MLAACRMAMEDMAMDSMAVGWSFAGLLIFVTVWIIMMVAMMLSAAVPMILIFAAASSGLCGCSGNPT
jgi:predicted metal-binding membrane protein